VSLLPGRIRACGRCGETPSQKVLFSRGGVLQCGGVVDYVENLDSKVRAIVMDVAVKITVQDSLLHDGACCIFGVSRLPLSSCVRLSPSFIPSWSCHLT
jgi:hypothetical protein